MEYALETTAVSRHPQLLPALRRAAAHAFPTTRILTPLRIQPRVPACALTVHPPGMNHLSLFPQFLRFS